MYKSIDLLANNQSYHLVMHVKFVTTIMGLDAIIDLPMKYESEIAVISITGITRLLPILRKESGYYDNPKRKQSGAEVIGI